MKLALSLGTGQPDFSVPVELVKRAEDLGFDSVWTSETYGADAMTPLAFLAAHTRRIRLGTGIAQLDARTPANLAMTAQTVDFVAGGGRMIVGIGVSGPQIVEGWYGRPWGKPNYKLRDTVAIMKKILRREGPVSHEGKAISLPYTGEGSIGLGKPLRSMLRGNPDIPIILGTSTPLNMRMTGELADGWYGMRLVPRSLKKYLALIEEGLAKRTDGKTLKDFELCGPVGVMVGNDVKALLQKPKAHLALYVGGMGAKNMNFHKDAMVDAGYGEAAERIQELFLAGRRDEATAAVPDEFIDELYVAGPQDRIAERFRAWRDSGLTMAIIRADSGIESLETMAKVVAS